MNEIKCDIIKMYFITVQ